MVIYQKKYQKNSWFNAEGKIYVSVAHKTKSLFKFSTSSGKIEIGFFISSSLLTHPHEKASDKIAFVSCVKQVQVTSVGFLLLDKIASSSPLQLIA